jgi:ribosome-associated toxin RatA of RatAB toxin-antitoxin module
MRDGTRSWLWAGRTGRALAVAAVLVAPAAARAVEAQAAAEVAESPDAVFALLTDFARWGELFPAVASLSVERVDEHSARLRTRTRVAGHTVRYTLAARIDADARSVDCVLEGGEPSDVRALASSWRLREAAGGGTRIELSVRSESGLPLPGFLERRITEQSARQSVDALVSALGERRLTLAAAD